MVVSSEESNMRISAAAIAWGYGRDAGRLFVGYGRDAGKLFVG